MYNIVSLVKPGITTNNQIKTGFGHEIESHAIGIAVNMVSNFMQNYSAGGKKCSIDAVFYDGMTVIRAVDAKSQFLYRLAIIKE